MPGFDGPDSNTEEYPLQFTGYHTKAHTHSSYANNQIIQDAHRHNVWINPLDAAERNIKTGDTVRVILVDVAEVDVVGQVVLVLAGEHTGLAAGAGCELWTLATSRSCGPLTATTRRSRLCLRPARASRTWC